MIDVVEELAGETVKTASAQLWPLADTEVTALLTAVHHWEQSVALLKARLVREAQIRGIPAGEGNRSVAGWLRCRLRLDPSAAREVAAQAAALSRRPAVEQAVLDGLLDMRQAMVVTDTVNAIPGDLATATNATVTNDPATNDPATNGPHASSTPEPPGTPDGTSPPEPASTSTDPTADQADPSRTTAAGMPAASRVMADAETLLIELAGQFPAYQLRQLGHRVLAHVAPHLADQIEEAALRRQEARANAKRFFTLSLPVNGMVRLSGVLDVEAAAIVHAALQPLCTPTPGDDRTPGQRRADALTDICRLALRTGDLPTHGAEPPQIAVTLTYDTLTRQLRAGTLDNGERIPATTARRLACDARIIPILLGSTGQVLDVGRTRRLATGALRRALIARDRGCTFPTCDRPPRWCDAHHLTPWSEGGPTNLNNLVLLCRHHHRTIHDPRSGWQVRLNHNELPEFLPPPWIDLLQRPQRNPYHPRT